MHESLILWIAFNAFVLLMLVLDLGVFHRNNEKMSFRSALGWTVFWVSLAAAFAVTLYFVEGQQRTLEFITGYIVEESLSVDNLFVFLTLFQFFRVPEQYQYKVLFWGIIGALVMRGIFIAVGVGLIQRFEWIIFVFGGFLIYTGLKMAFRKEHAGDPAKNPILRFARKHLRVTDEFDHGSFFVRRNRVRYATPLFLVLLLIEATDLLFAVDSIPAVLAVTRDAFIVYTSNVFAILGLRALFFTLAGVMERFYYVDQSVAAILVFVGGKMVASHWYDVPTPTSLVVIALILAISILASLIHQPAAKALKSTDKNVGATRD
jgi:tellurite resistance protein TerC